MPYEITHDIYHVDEPEGYDALQEVTAELEQAEKDKTMSDDRRSLNSLDDIEFAVRRINELEAKLANQTHMISQVFALLDVTEETEDGRVFHPNQIRSSRMLDAEKLESILAELKGQE
jgi:hypothetical protein